MNRNILASGCCNLEVSICECSRLQSSWEVHSYIISSNSNPFESTSGWVCVSSLFRISSFKRVDFVTNGAFSSPRNGDRSDIFDVTSINIVELIHNSLEVNSLANGSLLTVAVSRVVGGHDASIEVSKEYKVDCLGSSAISH